MHKILTYWKLHVMLKDTFSNGPLDHNNINTQYIKHGTFDITSIERFATYTLAVNWFMGQPTSLWCLTFYIMATTLKVKICDESGQLKQHLCMKVYFQHQSVSKMWLCDLVMFWICFAKKQQFSKAVQTTMLAVLSSILVW